MPASPSPAPWLKQPLGPGVSLSGRSFPAPPELTCHRPDGERGVAGIPPVFRGADVHAPQLPAVPVGGVLVALHFEVVLLDVVDGGEDDPLPVFLDAGKDRLGPAKAEKSPSNSASSGHASASRLLKLPQMKTNLRLELGRKPRYSKRVTAESLSMWRP